jgi:nucleoside-diphosphate-sugar epimerase
MRVLVLGGTGASGNLIIRECLQADHIVVVYARSPEKLPEDISKDSRVVVIKGSLEDEEALAKSMEGVQAVLSALGPSTSRGPFHPSNTPLAHAYSRIIRIMHAHNVKRLLALGTASIADPNDKFSAIFWALVNGVKTLAYNAYKDVVAIGDTIRGDGEELIWTIARVPLLTTSESKDVIAGYIGDGKVGTSLPRAAFAAFMVKELEMNEWTRKAPMISSP